MKKLWKLKNPYPFLKIEKIALTISKNALCSFVNQMFIYALIQSPILRVLRKQMEKNVKLTEKKFFAMK